MAKHTLIAYVEDVPGVLNRIASLFRRRNFNIDSLTVGRTEQVGVSRLTVVVDATEAGARLVEANLYKLVNVLRVDDLTHKAALVRELGLVKVSVSPQTRSQVLQLVEVFRARVVDVDEESLTIEVTGTPEKIGKFEMVLRPYGLVEMVRTGSVAMARGHEKLSANPPLVRAVVAKKSDHADDSGLSMSV
ncbi:acetolactate synthase small subunit [Oleiharenicola lentus]|uniref:acetolactate synthase small subunit n=1 Tax=Oleiharenicola lentus TaxID=2508720 RepID=UPI003F674910